MRRLTLHIGSHKTGTTTVQATLAHNEALLAARGLGQIKGDTMPNLHPYLGFVDHKAILPAGYKLNDPARFAALLQACPQSHVFGSSENFSFFFVPEAIDELARLVRPIFDEVTIVAYLRRQDRHAISHHQEGAKPLRKPEGMLWGHALTALPLPAPQHRLYLDYDARIAMWEQAFGAEALRLRIFDRKFLKDGDIVPDILALMGVDSAGLDRIPDKNVSLDRTKAKIGHLANEVLGNDRITELLLRNLPDGRERMLPSAEEARAFLEPYREGNRRLNERLKVTEFAELFPDDFSDYPEHPAEDWSDAEANMALRSLIGTLGRGQTFLNPVTIDDLRLAALALREESPETALRIVRMALGLRPNGPALQKLRGELEQQLGKPPGH